MNKLTFLMFFLLPTISFAGLESRLHFKGQNAEIIKAEKKVIAVKKESVEVQSTCSRQVPAGQRQVCEDQLRTRNDCRWIPSSERCWDDRQEVCRPVNRTRRECSGQEAREVCHERPSHQICKPGPRGTNICVTVGGGRDCRMVPGNQVCRDITEVVNDCRMVTNRRCETIPARNDCRLVTYFEPVCRLEQQWRTETYSCKKTEVIQRPEDKTLKSEIEVSLETNGLVEEFLLALNLNEHGQDYKDFSLELRLLDRPDAYVILKKKDLQAPIESQDEILVRGKVELEVVEKKMIQFTFPDSIESASIEKSSGLLTVVLGGSVTSEGAIELALTHKPFIFPTKTIAELHHEFPSSLVQVGHVKDKVAIMANLQNFLKDDLKKNMKLSMKLISKINVAGRILNDEKPVNEKTYEDIKVELK